MVSLIATAPAGLVEWMLPRITHDRVFLEQTDGGLWRGYAKNLKFRLIDGEFRSMGSVHWEVLFLSLVKFELAVKMTVDDGRFSSAGIVSAGLGKFHLRQIKATLPAFVLSEFEPAWHTWKPDGVLSFYADNFTIGSQSVSGAAELEWRNASVSLSQVKPLGDYRLDIQGGHKAAQLTVSTISGVLRLAGKGEWSTDNGLDFRGMAQSEPSQKEALRDLLALLGNDQGNGVYPFSIANVKLRK